MILTFQSRSTTVLNSMWTFQVFILRTIPLFCSINSNGRRISSNYGFLSLGMMVNKSGLPASNSGSAFYSSLSWGNAKEGWHIYCCTSCHMISIVYLETTDLEGVRIWSRTIICQSCKGVGYSESWFTWITPGPVHNFDIAEKNGRVDRLLTQRNTQFMIV